MFDLHLALINEDIYLFFDSFKKFTSTIDKIHSVSLRPTKMY